ncbi:hypothetical protein IFM58399_09990.2, partial [Aspergillus lentulus]|uniref:uncharacterized protein n=1 Tax=Aspergillus lentulus TaxID=293939 RepID=UPI0013948E92
MSLYDTVQVHMIEHHFIALPAEHGYAPVAKVLLTMGANADIPFVMRPPVHASLSHADKGDLCHGQTGSLARLISLAGFYLN